MIAEKDESYFWSHVGLVFDKSSCKVKIKKKRRCLKCRKWFVSSGEYICSDDRGLSYDGPGKEEERMRKADLEHQRSSRLATAKRKREKAMFSML